MCSDKNSKFKCQYIKMFISSLNKSQNFLKILSYYIEQFFKTFRKITSIISNK